MKAIFTSQDCLNLLQNSHQALVSENIKSGVLLSVNPRFNMIADLLFENVNMFFPAHIFQDLGPHSHTAFSEMCFLEQVHIGP